MHIEKHTRKSHYYNEDRYLVTKDIIMVMDGATSLEKSNLKPTSGTYIVNKIKEMLPSLKGNTIERLNYIANVIYNELNNNNNINDKLLPSCGLAWLEKQDDKIIIHTIGDCEAFVIKKDGSTSRIVIEDLIKLDNKALNELIVKSKENNISIKDARPLITDTLIKHRLLMNKDNGYSVFAPSSNPVFKYSTHVFNINELKEIYLYSDGFADAFTTFNLYKNCEELFNNPNLKEVIENIVKKANEDKLYNKYPRFKLIDDITVVKVTF